MPGAHPGRTQGFGLITEPLLSDLGIDRVAFATVNLWATLPAAAFLPALRPSHRPLRIENRYGCRRPGAGLLCAFDERDHRLDRPVHRYRSQPWARTKRALDGQSGAGGQVVRP